jgi:hypothetical protein
MRRSKAKYRSATLRLACSRRFSFRHWRQRNAKMATQKQRRKWRKKNVAGGENGENRRIGGVSKKIS